MPVSRGDFDRPQRLVVSYSYDLPVPDGNFWNNQFFKGWAVSGIVTYQSGLPFSITDSTSGGAFGQTGGGTASFSGTCGTDPTTMSTQGSLTARLTNYLNPASLQTELPEQPVLVMWREIRSVVHTSKTGTSR